MQHYLASWLYYSLYSSLPIPALFRPHQTSSPRLVSYHSILVVTTEAPRGGERRLGWATSTASCMMAAYDGAVLFLELFDGKACRPASRLSPLHAVSAAISVPLALFMHLGQISSKYSHEVFLGQAAVVSFLSCTTLKQQDRLLRLSPTVNQVDTMVPL
ncbi:hypothetical protein B296_00030923 [Ensete ventricosum]|uniref:Uncharacterized protein n=1 Tax=Ensete ventricosum TaxID=4639 RepID=A0A426YR08_ENSVE|nr:hypothetical protein B296_00030923 [Ensete ventricosum]